MSDRSNIEWTDATWNPVTGCTKVSPGCDNCYAETLAERFRGTPGHYYEHGFDVVLRPDKLDQPLRWPRPRLVFVNSMSDLFHADVPDDYIAQVFAVMSVATHHTFQLLTKRHGRMRALLRPGALVEPVPGARISFRLLVNSHRMRMGYPALPDSRRADGTYAWPLPNVWLGVSVEDQKRADLRVPALLDTPATVRFLSCEPLLGPVDIRRWLDPERDCNCWGPAMEGAGQHATRCACLAQPELGWVIVGGESGHHARPMDVTWARDLREQCLAAGVPFHFKQWGEWVREDQTPDDTVIPATIRRDEVTGSMRLGKQVAGRLLDGRTHDDMPGGVR